MHIQLYILCALFAFIEGVQLDQLKNVVVQTSSGLVKGLETVTYFRKTPYFAFRGIPYAEPPVGVLRFRPPQPIYPWAGVRDSFENGPNCLQIGGTGESYGSEDCLTINVYTKNVTAKQAVLVFVHGGGFYFGSGDSAFYGGPDMMIEQGVMMVSFNYRLGVFGNMALDDSSMTGNQGLKDQQMALRWIHQNVAAFGGDTNRITLVGVSSGSFAIQLHMLVPGSQGLFNRAILMSTACMTRQVLRPNEPQLLADLYEFFRKRNQEVDNIPDLIKLLVDVPTADLVLAFPYDRYLTLPMPSIEPPTAPYPFMQGSPDYYGFEENFNLTIDVLVGYTSNEGLGAVKPENLDLFLKNVEIDIPNILTTIDYTSETYKAAHKLIIEQYFPDGLTNNNASSVLDNFVRLLGDIYYTYPVDRIVRRIAQHSSGNTYHYVFDLDTEMNLIKNHWIDWQEVRALDGAGHADDLCYLFYCGDGSAKEMYADVVPGSNEYMMMRTMSAMYAMFAKTGEAPWGAVVKGDPSIRHMYFGMDGFVQRENAYEKERQFWDGIAKMFDATK